MTNHWVINGISVHNIKCRQPYFVEADSGQKTFTIRRTDKPYKLGDFIIKHEIDEEGNPTGRKARFRITYIITSPDYCKDGFAVLGIEKVRRLENEHNNNNDC